MTLSGDRCVDDGDAEPVISVGAVVPFVVCADAAVAGWL